MPIRKAKDRSVALEDEPLVGGAEAVDARRHLSNGRDVDLPADRRGQNIRHASRYCFHPRQYLQAGELCCCERAWRCPSYSCAMVDQISGPDAGAGRNSGSNPRRPTVYIATPMYGGMAAGIYTVSMVQLPAIFLRNGVDSVYAYSRNECLIPNARNVLADQFLESEATHLMWIDADIGFNPIDIVSMVIADQDIICGIYPKKAIDWRRVAQAVEDGVPPEELGSHVGSFVVKLTDGAAESDSADDLANSDGLVEIAAGGTGFMLIKRGVFEAL